MTMFKDFLAQLRATPRLRWGVALIIGTLWLYAVLLLHDNLQQNAQQYRSEVLAVTRLRARLLQPEWLARVEPAKTLAVQLESRLWQAATSGLAQAAFQDALNSVMAKAAVTKPLISVTVFEETAANSPPPQNQEAGTSTPTDLWKVKAKVGFDFNATTLLSLLSQIENHEKQIIVGKLMVNKDQPNHVDIELYAYFQKPTGTASKPAKAGGPS
jgi:hypothetical protein